MILQNTSFFVFATKWLVRKVRLRKNIARTRWIRIVVALVALAFL